MLHTIICWDCCFRNFFHTLDSIAQQNYPKDDYEMIFVEQRSEQNSNDYNHKLGFKSLMDKVRQYDKTFNIQALFLNQSLSEPYHLGVSNNAALSIAKGKIISVMDGDLLLKPDFLDSLSVMHHKSPAVYNLFRKCASKPVNADIGNWHKGSFDFDLCLDECPDKDAPIPEMVNNFGPMISAPQEWWNSVDGYATHRIWSTGVSKAGLDVATRLALYSNCALRPLQNQFCVHPYHPQGFNRENKLEGLVLSLQQTVINWTKKNKISCVKQRSEFEDSVYRKYKWAFEANISGKYSLRDSIRLSLRRMLQKQ